MSQPYIGEIRMFGGNFAPNGWSFCNGAILPIDQNTVLFELIGTTYGGDGQQTFALPDLRGRLPIHQSSGFGYVIGQQAGTETVTLTTSQLPPHNHQIIADTQPADTANPAGGHYLAQAQEDTYFIPDGTQPAGPLSPSSIGTAGGSQPHDNMHPFVGISFIISLFGIFPSQN